MEPARDVNLHDYVVVVVVARSSVAFIVKDWPVAASKNQSQSNDHESREQ